MKKYIALILAALLALSTLIGCTNTPAGQDTTTAKADETTKAAETEKEETTKAAETEKAEDDTTEAATEAEPSGEIPTIRLSYACIVITPSPESVDLVEENINKYLDEIDLGVHVDLDLLDGTNYSTIIDNAALAGEDLDIIMLQDLPAAVNSNKLLPLDPYLDNELAGTVETIGLESFAGCTFGGKVMSVPRYCTDVLTYYWVCDYEAQKPVLGLEEGTEFTIDELDEALLKLKEAYPDMITMGVFPASTNNVNSYQLSAVYGGKQYDNVTDLGSGAAIIGLDNYNVVNYYESDTFKKICEEGRKWYNEGLVNDDPSVESEHAYDLIKADRCLSYIIGYSGYNAQVTKAEEDNTHLKSVIYVPLANNLRTAQTLSYGIYQGSKNPSAAAKILNLLYTDDFFLNTLLYGAEGRDYLDTGETTPDGRKVVKYPEGQTMFTVPYTCFLSNGFLGNNYLVWPQMKDDGTYQDRAEENLKFEEDAVKSPVFGYSFDTANVQGEAGAINNVIQQYLAGLLTGELDPDEWIPTFNEELKAAGIDAVIAEAQTQVDAWVAANK